MGTWVAIGTYPYRDVPKGAFKFKTRKVRFARQFGRTDWIVSLGIREV